MPEIKNKNNVAHTNEAILNKQKMGAESLDNSAIETNNLPEMIKSKVNESRQDIRNWNESLKEGDKKFEKKKQKTIDGLGEFYNENLENIKKIKGIFENLDNLTNFNEEKGKNFLKDVHDISVVVGSLIEDAEKKGIKSDFIFKSFIEKEDTLLRREKLFHIENGIYRPYTPDVENSDFDGGDGWFLQKSDNRETGFIFDARGHGNDIAYEKIFIQKIFESLQNVPKEKNNEFVEKIDEIFENITHAGGHTAIASARLSVEMEDGKKKVSLEKYGDSLAIIYDPENNKVFYHGGLSENDLNEDFLEIKAKDKDGNDKGLNIPQIGYGFVSAVGTAPIYENIFSDKAEIVISSDGIADQHMKFKGDKNFEQVMMSFVEARKNGEKTSLVEYLKKELAECDLDGIVDDITILEIGASLK